MAKQRRELTTVPRFLEENRGLVSKNLIYAAIKDGTIRSVRIRKKILIPADCLQELLDKTPSSGRDNKPEADLMGTPEAETL